MAGEWRDAALGDVIELKRGYDLPRQGRRAGTIPIVSSSGVSGYHSDSKVRGPGVVTGRYGTLGEVFYVSEDFWPLNTTLYVTDFKGNDPRFISYFLRSVDFLAYSDKAAVPGINRNHLHQARVHYPSDHKEQRAIAHILGTLDDKIELNRRMNETLEAMAGAIFKSWFVNFDPVRAKAEGRDSGLPEHIADLFPDRFEDSELGEIPAGWKVGTLGDLSQKPQYGYTASATSEPIGPRFLRIADINKRAWIDWTSVPFCQISAEDYEKYKTRVGDILVARMADPGHGVMVEEDVDAVLASYLIRFQLRDAEYRRYIQYWLRSEAYWDLVKSRSAGTTRANLNAKVLSAFPLILPRRAITSAFREVSNSIRTKVVTNVNQSRTLASLRDALLPRLISGQLRVPDAERMVEAAVRDPAER
jgi:type I restriction enzyme, S subunit